MTEDTKADDTQEKNFVRFNDWLKASFTLEKGAIRKAMEDRLMIANFPFGEKKHFYLFVLCDGHGGSQTCDYIIDHICPYLQKHLLRTKGTRIREVLKVTFYDLHHHTKKYTSGSTLSVILMIHKKLSNKIEIWCANVGDSTVYGIIEKESCDKAMVRKISIDHNLDLLKEKQRVIDQGFQIHEGYIVDQKGMGVNLTRAIGDHNFEPAVVSTPEIRKLNSKYSTIVMASDGYYNVVTCKDMWKRICSKKEKRAWRFSAARVADWRNHAFIQHDNISLILIFIDWSKIGAYKPKRSPEQRSNTKEDDAPTLTTPTPTLTTPTPTSIGIDAKMTIPFL